MLVALLVDDDKGFWSLRNNIYQFLCCYNRCRGKDNAVTGFWVYGIIFMTIKYLIHGLVRTCSPNMAFYVHELLYIAVQYCACNIIFEITQHYIVIFAYYLIIQRQVVILIICSTLLNFNFYMLSCGKNILIQDCLLIYSLLCTCVST
jgi:hypothetical protein